jgi:integrase/recombinase XerC/integrase/recombinase XerD
VSLRRAATPGALAAATRAAEACGLYVEDLDLRRDDEHVRIHGKGGTVRTVLLDDRGYVALLRLYLARAGYTAGPLFRASINGSGGPLSYDAAHHRWEGYCRAAGVGMEIHQLRHAHATELEGAELHRMQNSAPGVRTAP